MNSAPGSPILLLANPSPGLDRLLFERPGLVDGLEIGTWFPIDKLLAYRDKYPQFLFLFHGSNIVAQVGEKMGAEECILQYLSCTESPWFSVHLMVWEAGEMERLMGGERLPLPDAELALGRLLDRIATLKSLVSVPVLIENLEPLTFEGYDFWSYPEFIRRVLQDSDCGFLLDTGHLQVAAGRLGLPIETYLDALPLERVIEVHVSGPRRKAGRLVDAHRSLRQADCTLLELLLDRVKPKAITLEYVLDDGQLSVQLDRLRTSLRIREGLPERIRP